MGDLKWVNSSYASMYGPIISNWTRDSDCIHVKVTIPANTTATIYVPASNKSQVTEGSSPAAQTAGVKWLRDEDGSSVFEVGSGEYDFMAK